MPREEGDLIFGLFADKCLNERLNKERDTSRKLKCKKYEKEFSEIKVCLFFFFLQWDIDVIYFVKYSGIYWNPSYLKWTKARQMFSRPSFSRVPKPSLSDFKRMDEVS